MKNITIAGRLTRDSKLNRTGSGDPVLSFAVAVDAWNGKEKGTEFFDVSMWGDRGARLQQYLTKGTQVAVSGDLGRREHEGRTYLTVRADNVTLMGGGTKAEEPEQDRRRTSATRSDHSAPATTYDDEIPF